MSLESHFCRATDPASLTGRAGDQGWGCKWRSAAPYSPLPQCPSPPVPQLPPACANVILLCRVLRSSPPSISALPGNTVPAVFAIPAANRPGFTGYFIPTPPSSYRNQAWMSYAGENELPSQWADSVRPLRFPPFTCG